MSLHIQAFLEASSSTFSYIVSNTQTQICSVIDSVLDYDLETNQISTQHADELIDYILENRLDVQWILETHIHADHLSAASYIKQRLGGKIGVSKHIQEVYASFCPIYQLSSDGLSHFDYFFEDDEVFEMCGSLATALYVPGHTPADLAFKIEQHIFVGDTLFAKDVGTARCDFPGGNAGKLYQSIHKILGFPAETLLYLCHDYPPSTRSTLYQTSIAEQKSENIHIKEGVNLDDFIHMRKNRDAQLSLPRLIDPALQTNLKGGNIN